MEADRSHPVTRYGEGMTPPASPPLRKDAAVNRQRLLDAARTLFAQRGLDVSLNEIAHHAGVGVGTAYRRFANKQEVIEALFEESLREVDELAERALNEPDAWNGMVGFVEQYLALQLKDRGLVELVTNTHVQHEKPGRMRTELAPKIDQVIERAKASGQLRPDVTSTDIAFMGIGLAAIMDKTRDAAPDLYLRILDIYLDGLRTDRARLHPLRSTPLSLDQTHAVTTAS